MSRHSVIVAIQGEIGSFHDQAAHHYFSDAYSPLFKDSFEGVFGAVVSGKADFGLSAVENSLVGSIAPVYDLLRTTSGVTIMGEIYLAIHHSLIGLPGASVSNITDVYSHPVALEQCMKFLKRELPHAAIHAMSDTAGSVDYIKAVGKISAAAIASANNARRLELTILRENIENNPQNYTRFLVLGRAPAASAQVRRAADKTSLLIEKLSGDSDDLAPGTLHRALGCFAERGIALTKIESRPIENTPWRYVFYLDCLAGAEDPNMKSAFACLTECGAVWRELGSYKSGQTVQPQSKV